MSAGAWNLNLAASDVLVTLTTTLLIYPLKSFLYFIFSCFTAFTVLIYSVQRYTVVYCFNIQYNIGILF